MAQYIDKNPKTSLYVVVQMERKMAERISGREEVREQIIEHIEEFKKSIEQYDIETKIRHNYPTKKVLELFDTLIKDIQEERYI